jgi:MFS family permease
VLLADLVAVSLLLVAYSLAPNLWVGAVAMTLTGAAYIGVLAGSNTLIQLHAPDSMRGRMLGIYMMALGVLYPIGALAQGAIANLVGIRAVTAAGAVVLLAVTGLWMGRRIVSPGEGLPSDVYSQPAEPPLPAGTMPPEQGDELELGPA